MSAEQAAEEAAEDTPTSQTPAANTVKFTPIIFTNEPPLPGEEEEQLYSPGRQNLRKWLGRIVRVTLKNKLVLIGIFSCTDHDKNLIIANCDTFMPDYQEPSAYGNVMVPGDQIEAFAVDMPLGIEELEKTDTEQDLEEMEPSKSSQKSS